LTIEHDVLEVVEGKIAAGQNDIGGQLGDPSRVKGVVNLVRHRQPACQALCGDTREDVNSRTM